MSKGNGIYTPWLERIMQERRSEDRAISRAFSLWLSLGLWAGKRFLPQRAYRYTIYDIARSPSQRGHPATPRGDGAHPRPAGSLGSGSLPPYTPPCRPEKRFSSRLGSQALRGIPISKRFPLPLGIMPGLRVWLECSRSRLLGIFYDELSSFIGKYFSVFAFQRCHFVIRQRLKFLAARTFG